MFLGKTLGFGFFREYIKFENVENEYFEEPNIYFRDFEDVYKENFRVSSDFKIGFWIWSKQKEEKKFEFE